MLSMHTPGDELGLLVWSEAQHAPSALLAGALVAGADARALAVVLLRVKMLVDIYIRCTADGVGLALTTCCVWLLCRFSTCGSVVPRSISCSAAVQLRIAASGME
tara:strand:+ start:2273 stop:2587 length:315 start_codon:yes stop_codon:yes gene_type:complete